MVEELKVGKSFIVVRLFPGWEDHLNGTFEEVSSVYYSMRVEIYPMDVNTLDQVNEEVAIDYEYWKSRHENVDLDSPFNVLIKTDLTREDSLKLYDQIRTAIYPDDPNAEELTYNNWIEGYKTALDQLELIKLPK